VDLPDKDRKNIAKPVATLSQNVLLVMARQVVDMNVSKRHAT
jgi:hypothetical protein